MEQILGPELGPALNMFVGGLVIVHVLVLMYWIYYSFLQDGKQRRYIAHKKRE
ncbi:hypothetical protein PINS_up001159 [Pythium insidiosum]|nr:hypothetical protein PINS_up001159 [Pythium insidiosum]